MEANGKNQVLAAAVTTLIFILYRAIDSNAEQKALTPRQWTWKYACHQSNDTMVGVHANDSRLIESIKKSRYSSEILEMEGHSKMEQDCIVQREALTWMYMYNDELQPKPFKVLVRDDSLDERLANLLYTTTNYFGHDQNIHQFRSGDEWQDERNRLEFAGSEVDDELCGAELSRMLDLIGELQSKVTSRRASNASLVRLEERHLRLGRVLDSFGRYKPGMLNGLYRAAGSPRQCLDTQLALNSSAQLTEMRFCWANFDMRRNMDPWLASRRRYEFEQQKTLINVGICIPRACHSKSLAKHRGLFERLANSQFKLPDSMYFDATDLDLDDVYCAPDEDSQYLRLSASTNAFITLTVAWLLLASYATYLGTRPGCRRGHLLASLDLCESWNDLFAHRDVLRQTHERPPIRLNALNGFRVFLCVAILVGHAVILVPNFASNTLDITREVEMNPRVAVNLWIMQIVDSFFTLSSLLLTYLTLKKLPNSSNVSTEQNNHFEMNTLNGQGQRQHQQGTSTGRLSATRNLLKKWSIISLIRYLRLVPMYFIIVWFTKSVYPLLGPNEAPMWDYGTNARTGVGACTKEPLWWSLTGKLIFEQVLYSCSPVLWSVAMEVFYAIILPPLIVILASQTHENQRASIRLLAAFIFFVLVPFSYWHIYFFYTNDPRFWLVKEGRAFSYVVFRSEISNVYTSPLYRAPVFLLGMLAGFAVFWYEQQCKQRKKVEWPHWFSGPATWFALTTIPVLVIFVAYVQWWRLLISPYHRFLTIHAHIGVHTVCGLSSAIILVRLVTDWHANDCLVTKAFASKVWEPLSRLCFGIYMIHYLVIKWFSESRHEPDTTNGLRILEWALITLAATLPLSVLAFVVLENPIDKLVRAKVQLMLYPKLKD